MKLSLPFRRNKHTLRVLVATADPATLAALRQFRVAVERVEALTTGGAYHLVSRSHLAIVDLDGLLETDNVSREGLVAILNRSGVAWTSPAGFTVNSHAWERLALNTIGAIEALPPKAIAFVSYSGGVGKTTCSIDLARFFTGRAVRLPAAVVELKHGASAIRTLLDPDAPHLYEIITQEMPPAAWNGVTLLPMEFQSARLLLGQTDELSACLQRIKADHVLTIFDAEPDHEFWRMVVPLVDEVYGLATPRPDALENAQQALADLQELANGHTPRVGLIVNQCRGTDKVGLTGVKRLGDLPWVDTAARYDGQLARRLMKIVYPGWRDK